MRASRSSTRRWRSPTSTSPDRVVARVGSLALSGIALAAACASTASAAPRPVAVSLNVDATTVETGHEVVVTARVKRLPHGYRIVITETRAEGKTGIVASCTITTCAASWTENVAGEVSFAAKVRHGSRVAGQSRVVVVRWGTSIPPAPPPRALPGHYCGLTNEGKSICFDVTADSKVANLRTESLVKCSNGGTWEFTLTYSDGGTIARPGLTYSYS